jgi:hypothetical protein
MERGCELVAASTCTEGTGALTNIERLEQQLHGSVEVVSVGAEEDPVERGQLLADIAVVHIAADNLRTPTGAVSTQDSAPPVHCGMPRSCARLHRRLAQGGSHDTGRRGSKHATATAVRRTGMIRLPFLTAWSTSQLHTCKHARALSAVGSAASPRAAAAATSAARHRQRRAERVGGGGADL